MDDRGRIYSNPSEQQIENKKLVKLNEDDMKFIRKMNELERKNLYQKKVLERKSNGVWGKTYFSNKGKT